MRTTRTRSLVAALLALMMVLAACGDGDNGEAAVDDADEGEELALDLDNDDADEEEAAEEEEAEEPAEEEADFDLVAAVTEYTETIPDGWMMHRTMEDFEDARQVEGTIIVDVRQPEEVEENGVVPGSINIPLRELAQSLEFIPSDQPVIVVCAAGWRAGIATSSLRMLGYDNVLGFRPGAPGWIADGNEPTFELMEMESFGQPEFVDPDFLDAVDGFLSTLPEGWLTAGGAEEVLEAQQAGAVLLDIRQPENFEEGTVDGALTIPIRDLAATGEIPTDTNVIAYCQSGWRTGLSMPILHLTGYDNVTGYAGNFDGFVDAGAVSQ